MVYGYFGNRHYGTDHLGKGSLLEWSLYIRQGYYGTNPTILGTAIMKTTIMRNGYDVTSIMRHDYFGNDFFGTRLL
jgi:hypothetical protein